MIRHEDVGMNLPARLGARLGERLDEAAAIRVVLADWFSPVAAIHDVINRAGILDSQLAGHASFMCQYQELTPYDPILPLFSGAPSSQKHGDLF